MIGAVRLPADPAVLMAGPIAAGLAVAVLLAVRSASPRLVPAVVIAAGAASIAVTVLMRTAVGTGAEPGAVTGLWILLEPALFLALVYVPVRWSPPGVAAAAASAAGAASALVVQRFLPGDPFWADLAASALWLVPSLGAAALAWYLRWTAAERERAALEARREQRLRLAGELHDFVAHDVSEIVARAQAGRMVLAVGDPKMAKLLEQIETAGVRALGSMDRTVHMLRDEAGARSPVGGLDDIDELARRFAESGRTEVVVDRRLSADVGRENGAVAYRAVVEALTNVRRHAPAARSVAIELTDADGWLRVSVADDGPGEPRSGPRSSAGLGLPGMAERAASLGGTAEAGPRRPHGWLVTVRLPLPDDDMHGVTT